MRTYIRGFGGHSRPFGYICEFGRIFAEWIVLEKIIVGIGDPWRS
jgi:hypothetical protein